MPIVPRPDVPVRISYSARASSLCNSAIKRPIQSNSIRIESLSWHTTSAVIGFVRFKVAQGTKDTFDIFALPEITLPRPDIVTVELLQEMGSLDWAATSPGVRHGGTLGLLAPNRNRWLDLLTDTRVLHRRAQDLLNGAVQAVEGQAALVRHEFWKVSIFAVLFDRRGVCQPCSPGNSKAPVG